MNNRIRCSDCQHLDDQDWCMHYVEHIPYARHWRTCDSYAGLPPLAGVRRALALAELSQFVAELRDIHEGRLLRLTQGVPERERFCIYALAGLRVLENDPAIVGRTTKADRQHGGIADDSDPRTPEYQAA